MDLFNWTICCLCQKDNRKYHLVTPEISTYEKFAHNLICFEELGELPEEINLDYLKGGIELKQNLENKKALWHKECFGYYNNTKLKRAEARSLKRQNPMDDNIDQVNLSVPKKQVCPIELTKRVNLRSSIQNESNLCIICDKGDDKDILHNASTFQLDEHFKECARFLDDTQLMAKLSSCSDIIALEVKYHRKCLVNLYNRYRGKMREIKQKEDNFSENLYHGIALAELINYIKDTSWSSIQTSSKSIFKLADLVNLYSIRIQQLGMKLESRINSTRLKERILANMDGVTAYNEGKDVYLAYNIEIGRLMSDSFVKDFDELGYLISRITCILRKDIFENKSVSFSESLMSNDQSKSVPNSVFSLVNMLLNGSDIKDNMENINDIGQSVHTISQLICFNAYKKRRNSDNSKAIRHDSNREAPVPLYIGLKMYVTTRKKALIDCMYELGLSVSYDRIMDIVTALGNNVCSYYNEKKVVCPPQLIPGITIIGVADNWDHDPSSKTSKKTGVTHGTSLSLFQNIHNSDQSRQYRPDYNTTIITKKDRKILKLPDSYTNITPFIMNTKIDIFVPKLDKARVSTFSYFKNHLVNENGWCNQVAESISGENYPHVWSGYHEALQGNGSLQNAVIAIFPLFKERSDTAAMMMHMMKVNKEATYHINPEQTPVFIVDQKLYCIAKQVQWIIGGDYCEKKYFVGMGGLHLEQAMLSTIGSWLEGSGFVEMLVQSKIATSGSAEGFLNAKPITKTRYIFQVTYAVLHILLEEIYKNYADLNRCENNTLDFSGWCEMNCKENAQFQYWFIVFTMISVVNTFVYAERTGNFNLYIESIKKFMPWFFLLNKINYARWCSIYLRDLENLEDTHPTLSLYFKEGGFVLQKTKNNFSKIAYDQGHEQNNGLLKSYGGAIGLTEDEEFFRRFILSSPECLKLILKFENETMIHTNAKTNFNSYKHHEDSIPNRKSLKNDVSNLLKIFRIKGNPFDEEFGDLVQLWSHEVMDNSCSEFVHNAEAIGRSIYDNFVKERLIYCSIPLNQPISKVRVLLFNDVQIKDISPIKKYIGTLKADCSMFAKMYISCSTRGGDIDEFFRHESQSYPPALSQYGKLRSGNKADLLKCLEKHITSLQFLSPKTDVTIFDGAALIRILQPRLCKTFYDYFSKIFFPHLQLELSKSSRIDVVWENYMESTLKTVVHDKRYSSNNRALAKIFKVDESTFIPEKWSKFLERSENKMQLFKMLSDSMMKSFFNKEVVVTNGSDVMTYPIRNTDDLAPCNHPEADTRILIHIMDALKRGYNKIKVRTVDTDIVVLCISYIDKMSINCLWIAFGTGKDYRYIPVHEIANSLGPQKALALPMFHALTGSDTTSFINAIGKKTFWKLWDVYPAITKTLLNISVNPQSFEEFFKEIEQFFIFAYNRTSEITDIDSLRKEVFIQSGKEMKRLPPTKASLMQHVKRSVYQGAIDWNNSLEQLRALPSPNEWGWTYNGQQWEPFWTHLPPAPESCIEFLKCRCRTVCKTCVCAMNFTKCTSFCTCKRNCNNV